MSVRVALLLMVAVLVALLALCLVDVRGRMILGRLDLRVSLDGRVAWWRFAVVNGDRSPYARRLHRATEDLPHHPARGFRWLVGPLALTVLWRCSRRRLAARRARLADWGP